MRSSDQSDEMDRWFVEMAKGRRFAVTGGGGYFGRRLGRSLVRYGAREVTLFDVHFIDADESAEDAVMRRVTGDIREAAPIREAVRQADVVFHVASYGMSGREQLNPDRINEINVGGTRNVLEACDQLGVKALVYTSTTNVVFAGQEIVDGDESLPYLEDAQYVDHYSRSKSKAEQLVRTHTPAPTSSRLSLGTACIRAAGIYGEGEQRHFPRILRNLQAGLFCFRFGDPSNRCEFIYVDNLVDSHLLAARALLQGRLSSDNSANVYFVSDQQPVNNFEFFCPLMEQLGYAYPAIRLPVGLVFRTAHLIEIVHRLTARWLYNFQPLLTRAEVFKTGVTHYFKVDKAVRELGFRARVPMDTAMARVVRYYQLEASFVRRPWSNHDITLCFLVCVGLVGIVIAHLKMRL